MIHHIRIYCVPSRADFLYCDIVLFRLGFYIDACIVALVAINVVFNAIGDFCGIDSTRVLEGREAFGSWVEGENGLEIG